MTGKQTLIEKEMGIPEAEFFRIAARFLDGRAHRRTAGGFVVEDGAKMLEVSVKRLDDRRITDLIVLPRIAVEFSFDGYGGDEVRALMTVIDRHFQRGGG